MAEYINGSTDILGGSVIRYALNTTTPNQAVIRKIIAGNGISISSTGVDPGTGDVTISIDTSGTGGSGAGGGTPTAVGTVTSVNMTAPEGLFVLGAPITNAGTIALRLSSGYIIPLIDDLQKGITAYNDKIVSLSYNTSSGVITLTRLGGGSMIAAITLSPFTTSDLAEGTNLYYTNTRARSALSFVAGSGAYNSATGVITIPTNTNQLTNGAGFITGNQNIIVSGDATGSGTTAITLTLATVNSNIGTFNNVTVNAKGLVTAASNIAYQVTSEKGLANGYASLNSSGQIPSTQLPSYVDDVLEYADLAAFPGSGETGKIYVTLDTNKTYRWSGSVYVEISASPGSTDAVAEGSVNLYFTNARARAAISLTTTGDSGASTYSSATGVINVPTYTLTGLGGVPTTRTITINGTSYDLSANRSWSVGTVTGSGSTNVLPKWTSASSIGNSLLDDDGTSASVALASGGAFNVKYLSAIKLALTGGTTFGSIDIPIGLDFLIRPDSIEKFKLSSTGLLKLANYGSGSVTGTVTYRLGVDSTGNVIEVTDGGGTVTSVSGAGTVSGLTLTGTVTGSGSLTLGGTLTLTSEQVATALGYTPYNAANPNGYISSYTETDTLASVTARGATTSTATTFLGTLYARKNQTAGDYTTAALWVESYGNTTTGIAFHILNNQGKFLEMRTDGILYWHGSTVWHAGNLTNLNQLSNGPGYITGYSETDTLTSVTGRGASTPSNMTIANSNPVLILKDTDNSGTGVGQIGYISFQDSGNAERAWIGYGSAGSTALSVTNGKGDVVLSASTGVAYVSSNVILHAGNYNSYSPTLTGGGASGTWGINVTGTAGSETLATVTGRGNATTSSITVNGDMNSTGIVYSRANQTTSYTTAALWTQSFGNTLTGIAFHISGVVGRMLYMNTTDANLYWNGTALVYNSGTWGISITGNAATATTAGSLTSMNISQFTNNSGYLTGESDTLASVTGRGSTTTIAIGAPNFYDGTGSYNVNLGSGGSEGRGLVAGYSGGSYAGIGYNVRHTTTGGSWIAPGTDTSSYILFTAGGFYFYGAPSGTAGRAIGYTTLGSFNSAGLFNAVNITVSGSQVLHAGNYSSYSTFSATVISGGNNGFANDVYYSGVRNPIWKFGNATTYGISYFQGTSGIGSADTIGIHPNGTATAAGSAFSVTPTASYVNNNIVWHAGNDGSGSGLDADLLDGAHASVGNNANYIVTRDGSGDIFFRYSFSSYVNTTDDVNSGSITNIIAKFGDNYHRSASAASVQTFLGLGSMAYASTGSYATRQDGTRFSTNYNSILSSGFFNGDGTPSNAPNSYGQLIVAKGIDTGLQIAGGFNANNLWFRGWGYGPEADGFHPWRQIWHDGNFNPGGYLPLTGGTLTGTLIGTSASFTGNVNWQGINNGNPRSLAIGYSGGSYGQAAYGVTFTSSGAYNYAINDLVSLWEAYDGLIVRAAGAGTEGTPISWTTVLDARRNTFTWMSNIIIHAANYNSYAPTLTGGNASGTWGINITGSAGSVPWSSVTSKPASWLDNGALTADNVPDTLVPSGFWQSYQGTGNPTGTWFNYVNVRHNNLGNGHGYQIGMSYYDNNLWFRSYQGNGSFLAWSRALGTYTDPYPSNMNQYVRTTDNVTFARVDATNYGVGNAIYFGGGNNYFNWDGARISSNVGIASLSDMRAPIFYDSQDTGYYVDPNSTSNLYAANFSASVSLQGTTWFGGYGPGSGPGISLENQGSFARFAFWGLDFYDWNHARQMVIDNNYVYVDNYLQAGASLRAPIFYDSNDTTYYGDFASTSYLRHLSVGDVNAGNDGGWNARLNLTGSSHARLDVKSNSDGIITTMYSHAGQGVGRIGTMSNHALAIMVNGSVAGYAFNNYLQGVDSVRAPIFYDSQDTAYYLDPNAISNLYSVISVETKARKNQSDGSYTTAALWTESYGNTTTGIAFHISGVLGKFLEMRTNGTLYWNGDAVIHSGNYNSYSPTLTGTGASGTWGINITGNADTVDGYHASAFALVNGNTGQSFGVFELTYALTQFNPSLAPRTGLNSMSIKMWDNYFSGTGLGSDYGTVMEYYGRGGHVDTQVYFDAGGGSWYRTAAYAAGWQSWQKYVTENGGTWNISISGGSATSLLLTASGSLLTQYGSGTIGYTYAITAGTSGLFPASDNSNATITINRHPGDYYSQLGFSSNGQLYYRAFAATPINTSQGWVTLLTSSNYNSYAPTLTGGGASGTWGINITGSAATATSATSATNALRIAFVDGPRNLSDRLPNTLARSVNWDFVTSGTVGGTGNYGGVMSFTPWDGNTSSTGDSSYQLAFINETSVNGAGLPGLRLRKGIDTTWGSWYTLLHAGNYSSYALPVSGGTVTGQVSINKQDSINTTTPGLGATFGLHFGGQTTANSATGITFSAGNADPGNANAGIYVQGSGAYGTRMYIATTDSYAAGAKTAIFIDSGGNVNIMRGYLTAAGDITAYSDIRLKENILTVENALEKVISLRGVTYNRKDNKEGKRHLGVIAQEVEVILPEVVNEDEHGMKHVAYGNMTAVLIEAIKEQQAQIEDLKKQIEFLAENR